MAKSKIISMLEYQYTRTKVFSTRSRLNCSRSRYRNCWCWTVLSLEKTLESERSAGKSAVAVRSAGGAARRDQSKRTTLAVKRDISLLKQILLNPCCGE